MKADTPLRFQECRACRHRQHYVRSVCSRCGSDELDLLLSAGLGSVYATTAVASRQGPRNVALVDLDEGPRVMTNVVGPDPDDVVIGMRVQLTAGEGLQTTASPALAQEPRP